MKQEKSIQQELAIEKKIPLWILVGPLLMLAALLVIMATPASPPLLMTTIALLGLPFCWYWRLPAATAVTSLLAIIVIYQLTSTDNPRTLWLPSLALAMALTSFITALCHEEVEQLFTDLPQLPAGQAQQHPLKSDLQKKIQLLEQKQQEEQKASKATIAGLKQQLAEKASHEFSHAQSMAAEKEALQQSEKRSENLQRNIAEIQLESTSLKQNCAELTERLQKQQTELQLHAERFQQQGAELQTQTQLFQQQHAELQIQAQLFQEQHIELQQLKAEVAAAAARETAMKALEEAKSEEHKAAASALSSLEQQLEEKNQLLNGKNQEIEAIKERQQRSEEQSEGLLQEIFQRRHECTLLKQRCEKITDDFHFREAEFEKTKERLTLELEETKRSLAQQLEEVKSDLALQLEEAKKVAPDQQLAKAQGLYKQLQEQFADKSDLLNKTRQELFAAGEDKAQLERQLRESELQGEQLEHLASLKAQLKVTTDELTSQEKLHREEIEALQAIITKLSAAKAVKSEAAAPSKKPETAAVAAKPAAAAVAAKPATTSAAKAKPAAKARAPKQTKTTNWANTILSRCSEPHDRAP